MRERERGRPRRMRTTAGARTPTRQASRGSPQGRGQCLPRTVSLRWFWGKRQAQGTNICLKGCQHRQTTTIPALSFLSAKRTHSGASAGSGWHPRASHVRPFFTASDNIPPPRQGRIGGGGLNRNDQEFFEAQRFLLATGFHASPHRRWRVRSERYLQEVLVAGLEVTAHALVARTGPGLVAPLKTRAREEDHGWSASLTRCA